MEQQKSGSAEDYHEEKYSGYIKYIINIYIKYILDIYLDWERLRWNYFET